MARQRKADSTYDSRKQSIYMPARMIEEIRAESDRLDRSVSWLIQRAWKMAHKSIAAMPGVAEPN